MTSCCRYTDLKSSVYNQNGEGYFQQLKAYNHMTTHLKKVYTAKSVIDSRNPNYVRRRQICQSTCRDRSLDKCYSRGVIDKLAFDTQHHPIDFLRMGCNLTYHCEKCNRTTKKTTYCDSWYTECHKSQLIPSTRRTNHDKSRPISQSRISSTGLTFHSASPELFMKKNWKNQGFDASDDEVEMSVPPLENREHLKSSPRSAKSQYQDEPTCSNYPSSFETSPGTSRHSSPEPKASQSSESSIHSPKPSRRNKKMDNHLNKNSEDLKYSKFLYEITQEIVQNGYYTDEELKKVFDKHIKKNSSKLDRNKMLYEVYQLKLSLNIMDPDNEEEDDENIEEFMNSGKFLSSLPVKPPTPPKVLDENKILDKLKNQDELRETYSRSPHNGRHTVVLVDANPELLVTERDVLVTLMEMNLDAKQAQDIYRRLQNKSQDIYTEKNKIELSTSTKKSMEKGVQSRFTPCGTFKKDPDSQSRDSCSRLKCRTSNYSDKSLGTRSRGSLLSGKSEKSISKSSLKIKKSDEIAKMMEREKSLRSSRNSSISRHSGKASSADSRSLSFNNEHSRSISDYKEKDNASITIVEKSSEDSSRAESIDEKLASIQEISAETGTKTPTENYSYSTDEEIEEEASLSENSQPYSSRRSKLNKTEITKSDDSIPEMESTESESADESEASYEKN